MTPARWLTLLQLSRGCEGMTQRELADRLGVEGPTIGRLLDGHEKQALVERRPVENDRRSYHIHLQAAAKPILKEINRTAAGLRRELLSDTSLGDLTTCVSVLRTIATRLDKQ